METHDKKLVKYIRKLNGRDLKNPDDYFNELRKNIYENGYEMTRFVIHPERCWHVVVYRKKDLALLAIIKCGFKSHTIFGTMDLKIFRGD